MQNAECKVQTQNDVGPHERGHSDVCAHHLLRFACSHLHHNMWPLVLLSLESYTVLDESSRGSKTASAAIASPAPTGKSWTTRSQPSKRIRSLSTFVVTEAASGLQPCVKIDSSKLVMLTQLDVFNPGGAAAVLFFRRDLHSSALSVPCLCLTLFARHSRSSRLIIPIHWRGRLGMCR